MAARLELDSFLPYRLSVLSNRVSAALAALYEERFDLTPAEWRVMAALGSSDGLSAREVAARTAMDKVQVSRAVAALAESGRVERRADNVDGRVVRLRLSGAGRAVYDEIVPIALALESQLISVLNYDDRAALDRVFAKLTRQLAAL